MDDTSAQARSAECSLPLDPRSGVAAFPLLAAGTAAATSCAAARSSGAVYTQGMTVSYGGHNYRANQAPEAFPAFGETIRSINGYLECDGRTFSLERSVEPSLSGRAAGARLPTAEAGTHRSAPGSLPHLTCALCRVPGAVAPSYVPGSESVS